MVVTNGYCTQVELKARLRVTDTIDNNELDAAINAVSRYIDHYCQRHFYQDTGARTFAVCDSEMIPFGMFGDLTSVSMVATDVDGDGVFETVWNVADYQLLPLRPTAAPETKPFRQIKAVGSLRFPLISNGRVDRLQITGVWGWPAIPNAINQACLIQAARVFKRREAPEGIIGLNQFGVVRVAGRPDPDFEDLVRPYRLGVVA